MNKNLKKILNDSNYINKQIFDNKENESQYRWANKEIINQVKIFEPSQESLEKIAKPSVGQLLINEEIM